jgi:eukaryotic-like serine/threonine-protein kinase
MSDDARILELAAEALDSDKTPEEVCAQNPELLVAVKQRLSWCHSVDVMVENLFPSTSTVRSARTKPVPGAKLPSIPGYDVLGILGRGGAGVVYRVRHVKLNRIVALKMLLSGQYASAADLSRFMREARAVAALGHPNIVQIYDVGELDGLPFYTMEFVEGGTLARKLKGVPHPPSWSAPIVATLARAVHVAHQHGIIHRDLKPGNVLLTPDGTLKITDFGLAVHLTGSALARFEADGAMVDGDAAILRLARERVGTPSYMAPEQAVAPIVDAADISPSIDIYALGTILYEMLTGNPPFQEATAAQTYRRLVTEECAPPSGFNFSVSRDLDAICLKCLNKLPSHRYESAAALADDLDRFVRHEPVKARRSGVVRRVGKWMRRQPAIAAAITAILVLAVVAGGSALWYEAQRARVERSVDADLAEVRQMETAGRWENAEASLRRAEGRLDVRSSDELRKRVSNARSALGVATRLDAIELSRATAGTLAFYKRRADADYETAFRESMGFPPGTPIDRATALISASPVHGALVAALDDWATCAADRQRRNWILELARHADPDPNWRDRLRNSAVWDEPAALEQLSRAAAATGPASALLAVADRLQQLHKDSTALLRRVQKEHLAEFWPNLVLGQALQFRAPVEAGVYFRTALAARPEAAVGYNCIGDSLAAQGHFEEAVPYFKKALDRDPNYVRAKCNLADALKNLGRFDEALEGASQVLRLDPNYAWAHYTMAGALVGQGRPEQAVDQFAIIYNMMPDNPAVEGGYRGVLVQLGRAEEARVVWGKMLETMGDRFSVWTGYPEVCLFVGDEPQYRRARQIMLERFSASNQLSVIEPLARACLLVPPAEYDKDVLHRAVAMADRALAAREKVTERQYQYYIFLKGLADYRTGRFDDAVRRLDDKSLRVMGPCPRFVQAMALKDLGKDADARRVFSEGVTRTDWRAAKANARDPWIYHILRREAEAKVFAGAPPQASGPRSAALSMDPSRSPQDNDERLAILATCQFQKLNARFVEVFTDAVAAEPTFIQSRSMNPAFVLASASCALALCYGSDARADISEGDRSRLRSLACGWLSEELAMQLRFERPKHSESRGWLQRELLEWKRDPGLASLRDPAILRTLTPQQRDESAAFWQSVDDAIARLKDPDQPD